jgi:hypothetical protein
MSSLIRRWDRLRQWVDEEAESGEWYRRVEDRKRIVGAYSRRSRACVGDAGQGRGKLESSWAKRLCNREARGRFTYADINQFLDDSLTRPAARSAIAELVD